MKHRARRGEKQWEKIILEQEKSGLSAKRFCHRESIGLSSFYQWRHRLSGGVSLSGEKNEAPVFIDMGRIEGGGAERSSKRSSFEIALDLGDGVKLTLRRS